MSSPAPLSQLPSPGSLWRYNARESRAQFRVIFVANQAAAGSPYDFPLVVVYEDREGNRWAQLLSRWLERLIPADPQRDLFEESGW